MNAWCLQCCFCRVLELQLMYDTYHRETVDALKIIGFVCCEALSVCSVL